jgi:hypothetical protein
LIGTKHGLLLKDLSNNKILIMRTLLVQL